MAAETLQLPNNQPEDVCKYCRQSASATRPLFYPCKCAGTMRYVHEDCLKTWLETSQGTKCEVCNYSFQFESIWKNNTPDSLPVSDIVHGLFKSVLTIIRLIIHRSMIVFMWVFLLPLTVSVLYEAAFPEDEKNITFSFRFWKMTKLFSLTYRLFTLNLSFNDWWTGLSVVLFNCITIVGMLYLREQLMQVIEKTRNEQREQVQDEIRQNIQQIQQQRAAQELTDAIHNALRAVETDADRQRAAADRPGGGDQNTETTEIPQTTPQVPPRAPQQPYGFSADEDDDSGSAPQQQHQQQPFPQVIRRNTHHQVGDSVNNVIPNTNNNEQEDEEEEEFDEVYDEEYTIDTEESDDNSDESDWQDTDSSSSSVQEDQPARPNQQQAENRARQLFDENPAPENPNDNNVIHIDITWQRVFGFDDTYNFFEYVFYAFILNALAIYILWFMPMWIGKTVFRQILFPNYSNPSNTANLPRILAPLRVGLFIAIGYGTIALTLGMFGKLRKVLYVRKRIKSVFITAKLSNSMYMWLKVAILMINELVVYPTTIGIWINLCSINLVGNSLEWRIRSFEKNPLTFLFFHWLAGMVVVFQFVSGVISVRQVTRPGLIWFVRNLEDHDYSPLRDMLESTFLIHIKRFCYTCALLGWCIFVCVYIPTEVARQNSLVDLPFIKSKPINETSQSNETSIEPEKVVTGSGVGSTGTEEDGATSLLINPLALFSDIPKHFILLQILLPMLNMDGQRIGKKLIIQCIKIWCQVVGFLLGLKTYLLGINESTEDEEGEVWQPILNLRRENGRLPGGGRTFQMDKYKRKEWFPFRVTLFLILLVATLSTCFGIATFIPILLGRKIIETVMELLTGDYKHSEEVLNAWVFGAVVIWAPINLVVISYKFVKRNYPIIFQLSFNDYRGKIVKWTAWSFNLITFGVLVAVIMPLILGLYVTQVVVSPLKLNQEEDSLIYLTNDWIFGVLLQKIAVGICLFVPQEWGWRNVITQVYANGQPQLKYTFNLCVNITNFLLTSWAVPYVIAYGLFPAIIPDAGFLGHVQHTIYPTILAMLIGIVFAKWQIACFKALCEKLKQKKYLVGNRLVNNESNNQASTS